jgi:hypothetical protein
MFCFAVARSTLALRVLSTKHSVALRAIGWLVVSGRAICSSYHVDNVKCKHEHTVMTVREHRDLQCWDPVISDGRTTQYSLSFA